MPPRHWENELEKVAVTNDEIVKPTAIYIATLRSKLEDRGIDQKLFILI